MPLISTKLHGAGDYAMALTLISAPKLLRGNDRRLGVMLRATGAGMLITSALTDYELGLQRKLPMKAHLAIDAGTGVALTGAGALLRARGAGLGTLLRLALIGGGEVAAAALTEREPGDRRSVSSSAPADAAAAREQTIAAGAMDLDPLVARAESDAASAAAAIGGATTSETGDPAMDPVYQAGGGEQEGFEAAEQELVQSAGHGDGGSNPRRDAFTPEAESDLSGAVDGEPDSIRSSELSDDQLPPQVPGDQRRAGVPEDQRTGG